MTDDETKYSVHLSVKTMITLVITKDILQSVCVNPSLFETIHRIRLYTYESPSSLQCDSGKIERRNSGRKL